MDTTITKDELVVLVNKICTEQCDAPYDDECEHEAIHCAMKYLIHELKLQNELIKEDDDDEQTT